MSTNTITLRTTWQQIGEDRPYDGQSPCPRAAGGIMIYEVRRKGERILIRKVYVNYGHVDKTKAREVQASDLVNYQ